MEKTTGGILIQMKDSGPGIDPQDMEKVFEPYFSKRPGGTGLGLTLSRRIVEAHGGSISARNLEQGGACFDISLPEEGY